MKTPTLPQAEATFWSQRAVLDHGTELTAHELQHYILTHHYSGEREPLLLEHGFTEAEMCMADDWLKVAQELFLAGFTISTTRDTSPTIH